MQGLMQRVRGVRHLGWIALLVAMAAGCMLLQTGGGAQPRTELEARMERVLSCVEGAGKVRVVVMQEEVAAAFGAGANSGVRGVVVVAQGAGDLRVSMGLTRAVQALLDIDASKIEVLEMEGG